MSASPVRDAAALRPHQWWLLALLFVLTACTVMRLPGIPAGAGEVGLAMAWLGACVEMHRQIVPMVKRYRVLFAVWGGYLLIVIVAGIISRFAGRLSPGWMHDLAGFGFSIGAAALLLLRLESSPRGMQDFAHGFVWLTFGLSCFAYLLIICDYVAGTTLFSGIFNANFWWYGRFNAWAEDPNQWALLLLVAGMLMVLLPGRLNLLALAVLGWLLLEVRSDAAILGMLAFAASYAALVWWRQPDQKHRGLTVLAVFVVLFGLFQSLGSRYPPSPVLRAIGAVSGVQPSEQMLKKKLMKERRGGAVLVGGGDDKLTDRIVIWEHSLEAWRHSPVIGLGPGAYSGSSAAFQNKESHNLYMQIMVNAGLAGLLLALALLLWLSRLLWRQPETAPWLAGLVGLLVQGMGQYLMRHPVFWMFIVLLAWRALHAVPADGAPESPTELPAAEA